MEKSPKANVAEWREVGNETAKVSRRRIMEVLWGYDKDWVSFRVEREALRGFLNENDII